MATQNEIRERITNTIITTLEKGGLPPWRMPWRSGLPENIVSNRQYRGINPLLLQISNLRFGFASKYWGTFRQWDLLGGKVKRRPDDVPSGEWGTNVVFFKPTTIMGDNDEKTTIFVLRNYTVFNLDQVEGDHLNRFRVGHAIANDTDPIVKYENADRAIEATNAEIRYGGDRAFYHRLGDFIQVPCREQFTAPEFYETVLHELVHWTEHPTRLDWNRTADNYPHGELIAEIGSCFLATELGLPTNQNLSNHISYLDQWLKLMRSEHRYIFTAATQANKAADYLLSFSRTEQPVPEETLAN